MVFLLSNLALINVVYERSSGRKFTFSAFAYYPIVFVVVLLLSALLCELVQRPLVRYLKRRFRLTVDGRAVELPEEERGLLAEK